MKVLVAYATKNGSTQQVAAAVAMALRGRGAEVTLLPARAAGETVAGYDLVVLGAPLYSGRWHRDAHRFPAPPPPGASRRARGRVRHGTAHRHR